MNILFLLAECPGFFVDTIFALAQRVKDDGHTPIFASTTRYYEQFRNISLSELGRTYYFSDFRRAGANQVTSVEKQDLDDYWPTYPTYVRTQYYLGKHINPWSEYRFVRAFFQNILERESIELAVSEPPSSSFLYLGFRETNQRHIPFLGYMAGRLANCFNVFTDEFATQLVKNPLPPALEAFQQLPPDYMSNPRNSLTERFFVESPLNLTKKTFLALFQTDRIESVEIGKPAGWQLRSHLDVFRRKYRYALALRANVFQQQIVTPPPNTINVLFPLQFRPEASTSVLAREYESDTEVIRNIAFSLPGRSILYVKEHPSAVGIRSVDFYRKILSYPNVSLLHPNFSLRENLERFDAVVTLTSTVGFEALQKGIPVIILGRAFYEAYPGAQRVDSFQDLYLALQKIQKQDPVPNESVLMQYIDYSFLGTFNYLQERILHPSNIEKLVAPIRLYSGHQ